VHVTVFGFYHQHFLQVEKVTINYDVVGPDNYTDPTRLRPRLKPGRDRALGSKQPNTGAPACPGDYIITATATLRQGPC
jgi:hypothetical protein